MKKYTQCSNSKCQLFFRSIVDLYKHELYNDHCQHCGFGFVVLKRKPLIRLACVNCRIEPVNYKLRKAT